MYFCNITGTYISSPMKGLIQDMTEYIYYIIWKGRGP